MNLPSSPVATPRLYPTSAGVPADPGATAAVQSVLRSSFLPFWSTTGTRVSHDGTSANRGRPNTAASEITRSFATTQDHDEQQQLVSESNITRVLASLASLGGEALRASWAVFGGTARVYDANSSEQQDDQIAGPVSQVRDKPVVEKYAAIGATSPSGEPVPAPESSTTMSGAEDSLSGVGNRSDKGTSTSAEGTAGTAGHSGGANDSASPGAAPDGVKKHNQRRKRGSYLQNAVRRLSVDLRQSLLAPSITNLVRWARLTPETVA